MATTDEQLNVQAMWSSTLSSKMKLVKMIASSKRPLPHPAKGMNQIAKTKNTIMNEDLITLTDEDLSDVEQELIRPERVQYNNQSEEDSLENEAEDIDEFSNHNNLSYGDPRVIEEDFSHHHRSNLGGDDTENEDEQIEMMRSRVPAPTAQSTVSNRILQIKSKITDHRSSIGDDPRLQNNGRQSAIIPNSPSKK